MTPTTKRSPRSRNSRTQPKQEFSLVPAGHQRRIYELAMRSILLRELLGHAAERHADFAEIGALTALHSADIVFPSIHSVGARLAQASDFVEAAAEFAALRTAHAPSAVASPGLSSAQSLLASAIDKLLHKPDRMAILCTGELTNRSLWDPVFRFVGRHRLPILFIVTGHYHSRRESTPDLRTIYAEFGIPVMSCDAYDSIAAYRVATEAAYNARAGRGATVLESSLILTANRDVNSQAPLDHLEQYMLRHGSWDEAWRHRLELQVRFDLKALEERSA